MKSEKKLALILMIIAAFIVFIIGNSLGVVLAIISLIISSIELKNKELLNKIAFVGSIIIIVLSVVFFIISFNSINNTLSKAKSKAGEINYNSAEYKINFFMESLAMDMIRDNVVNNGKNIVEKEILDKYSIPYPEECDVYVVANINFQNRNENTFKPFLKCDNYTTTGYDKNHNINQEEDTNDSNQEISSNNDNSWKNGKFVLCEKEYTIKDYFTEMMNNGWIYNYDNTDTFYNLSYGLDKEIELSNENCKINVSVEIVNLTNEKLDIRNTENLKKTQIKSIKAEIVDFALNDDFLLSNYISKNSNISEIKKLYGEPNSGYASMYFYFTNKTNFGKSLSLEITANDEHVESFELGYNI